MLRTDTLTDEHLAIESLAADLLCHARAQLPCIDDIAQTRWQLSRLLLTHLAAEDRLLHPMLQRGPCPRLAAVSIRLQATTGELAEVFKAYMRDWDGPRIESEPAGFAQATGAAVCALRRRIRAEEMQLYRHIPSAGPAVVVDAAARRA